MKKQLIVHYDDVVLDTKKVVTNLQVGNNNKPKKALWSSSVYVADEGYITSEWLDFCVGDYHADELLRPVKYILKPRKGLKIYEIDSFESYLSADLLKVGSQEAIGAVLDSIRAISATGGWVSCQLEQELERLIRIDYEAMREAGYDAIHFTHEGARVGHSSTSGSDWYSMERLVRDALNSVDVESTVWLNGLEWAESIQEEDSWFDYTWDSVKDGFPLRRWDWYAEEEVSDEEIPWYESYDESDLGLCL